MLSVDASGNLSGERLTLTQRARRLVRGVVDPIADRLARWGVTPNALTATGLLANVAAGLLIARGDLIPAAVVLVLLGPLDHLDGALARRLNQSSKSGAYLDSTFDRLSEIALYLGLLWYFQGHGSGRDALLVYLAATGSVMVSYARARAEGLGVDCQTGLLTRLERFIVLLAGLLTGRLRIALGVLAGLTYFTVYQRISHTRKRLAEDRELAP